MVASHVAAESHHKGYKGIQWDVWLSRPSVNIFDCLLSSKLYQWQCCFKLTLKALFYRAHECEGLAKRGFRRLLPEALAKFLNCPFSSQLRKCNRWCCSKLMLQAVCVRVYEYACPRCCSTRLLQDVLTILSSSISPPADCATFGEIPMSVVRLLQEALAKFSNCSLGSQL